MEGGTGSGVRTFLIADIRGYTRYTSEKGDEAGAELATRFAGIVQETVEARAGKLIELRGDEALVSFDSARQALRAAVELQARTAEMPLGIGIGLDAGEAVPVGDGYRGGALNVAARLCARAGPGDVLASELVVQLARTVEGIHYGARRSERLKGLSQPVTMFPVSATESAPGRRLARPSRRMALAAAAVAAVAAAAVVAAIQLGSGHASGTLRLVPNSVAGVDAATGRVVSDLALGGSVGDVVTGSGRVWALRNAGREVTSVASTGRGGTKSFSLGDTSSGQWAGGGSADIANDFIAVSGAESLRQLVLTIGVDTGAGGPPVATIGPLHVTATDHSCPSSVTGSGTTVWFARGRRLATIDAGTGLVRSTTLLPPATDAPRTLTCYSLQFAAGRLLAARSPDASIGVVDPKAATYKAVVSGVSGLTPASQATTWVATGSALWILEGRNLVGADLASGHAIGRIALDVTVSQLAVDSAGEIWALGGSGRELLQVDPAGKHVSRRLSLGEPARSIASGYGRIWLAVGSA